jgi:hypothetical protein
MADQITLNEIINRAVSANLGGAVVLDVESRPDVDFYGDEFLRVTVVLKRGTHDGITGSMAVDALRTVADDLEAAGEHRRPSLTYVAEEELEADAESDGDPQS